MSKEPGAMREIHEIQERIYDREKHLSVNERIDNTNKLAKDMIHKYGIRCNVLKN